MNNRQLLAVLLLTDDSEGRYRRQFQQLTAAVHTLPVFEDDCLVNSGALDDRLLGLAAQPQAHAIIISSQRAVRSLAYSWQRLMSTHPELHANFPRSVQWFVVGPRTTASLAELFATATTNTTTTTATTTNFSVALPGRKDLITSANSAGELVPLIVEWHRQRIKTAAIEILYLTGDKTRGDLIDGLESHGVHTALLLQQLQVYETRTRPQLPTEIGDIFSMVNRGTGIAVVVIAFFSPSGVDASLPAVIQQYATASKQLLLVFACIGQTTRNHLEAELQATLFDDRCHPRWRMATSASPTPADLYQAVVDALKRLPIEG
jgi:uroporphyrinogen-III synthase